jgi:hypothetical protein
VIKYSKITGAKLLEDLSPEFLGETLGIIGDNEHMKFRTEIDKVTKSKVL